MISTFAWPRDIKFSLSVHPKICDHADCACFALYVCTAFPILGPILVKCFLFFLILSCTTNKGVFRAVRWSPSCLLVRMCGPCLCTPTPDCSMDRSIEVHARASPQLSASGPGVGSRIMAELLLLLLSPISC